MLDRAARCAKTITSPNDQAASGATPAHPIPAESGGGVGHGCFESHGESASTSKIRDASGETNTKAPPHHEREPGTHYGVDNHINLDARFSDPLIAEVVETWRLRQDMVRAQTKLTLQIKSTLRRFVGGDKAAAEKLYKEISKGEISDPLAQNAQLACLALLEARTPLERQRASLERHLTKLGKQLPIACVSDDIKGIGHLALAKIVAECGDLSAYKSVSAVWKRAGLAVIHGERQRRKSDPDLALEHGYSPDRRAVMWNIADALLKAQGKDEAASPYRKVYDARKAYERPRVDSDGHAHNRAMRHMMKALLKDLTVTWKKLESAC